MIDRRAVLKSETPFSYKKTKSNKALIYWNGQLIKTIHGKNFDKLESIEQLHNVMELQLFLAKITGHFKHGNER